ncbi:MAG: hypothetical protein ACPHFO_09165 [Acidimicrobiales bacterium]
MTKKIASQSLDHTGVRGSDGPLGRTSTRLSVVRSKRKSESVPLNRPVTARVEPSHDELGGATVVVDGGGATVVVDGGGATVVAVAGTVVVVAGTVVVDDGADGSVSADVNRAVPPHAASDVATRAHRPMVFIAAAVGKYFIRVSISGGVEVLMRGSTDVDTKCASICCIDDGVRASLHREC